MTVTWCDVASVLALELQHIRLVHLCLYWDYFVLNTFFLHRGIFANNRSY